MIFGRKKVYQVVVRDCSHECTYYSWGFFSSMEKAEERIDTNLRFTILKTRGREVVRGWEDILRPGALNYERAFLYRGTKWTGSGDKASDWLTDWLIVEHEVDRRF